MIGDFFGKFTADKKTFKEEISVTAEIVKNDWAVTKDETVENKTILSNEKLSIEKGAILSIRNSTIMIKQMVQTGIKAKTGSF